MVLSLVGSLSTLSPCLRGLIPGRIESRCGPLWMGGAI